MFEIWKQKLDNSVSSTGLMTVAVNVASPHLVLTEFATNSSTVLYNCVC